LTYSITWGVQFEIVEAMPGFFADSPRPRKIGGNTRIERSLYCATTYALEGFSEPLAHESSSIST
jgi:hypothetical protein